jgi:hypothetical protein
VVLLHPRAGTQVAHRLTRAWEPTIPAAKVSTLLIADSGGADEASAQIAGRLEQAGLDVAHLVLAGICGAEETALQLVFGSSALACAGVLACGDVLPPLALLAGSPARPGTRLRLVWKSDQPLFSATALGDLVRCLRAAGVDAQGSVLQRQHRPPGDAQGDCELSPAFERLGGAYLAELVAVALGAAPPVRARPVRAG